MKKFGLQTILTAALGFVAHLYFPFWVIAPVAGLIGLLFRYENSAASYAAGFVSCSLLWGGYATYLDTANTGLLSLKMGELFHVGGSYLGYLTGLVGGVLGGFGAMTGTLLRKIFDKAGEVSQVA
jgi:hypothetical protein